MPCSVPTPSCLISAFVQLYLACCSTLSSLARASSESYFPATCSAVGGCSAGVLPDLSASDTGCSAGRDNPICEEPKPPSATSGGSRRLLQASTGCIQYSNPVLAVDFPDPSSPVDGGDGFYYIFATNGGTPNRNVQAARAPKSALGSWTLLDYDALPFVHSWSTLQGGFVWAPEVAVINGHFVMYVTLHYAARNVQAIGIATSPTAAGPYIPYDTGYPFISQFGALGALDAYPFLDTDGSWYMYWRAPSADGITPHIYGQAMTPDGLSLVGVVSDLLAPTDPWEFANNPVGVIEGPAVTKCYYNTAYCLFYSGSATQTEAYATGVAVSSSPYGPFVKYPNNPLLATGSNGSGMLGPGGPSFMLPGNGQVFVMYHSWNNLAYTARQLNMDLVNLDPGLLPLAANLEVSFIDPSWQRPVCQ